MSPTPYLHQLLMLALNIVPPRLKLQQGEHEGQIGEQTGAAIRRFLTENNLTVPTNLAEQSPEWIQWVIQRLESATKGRFLIYGEVRDNQEKPLAEVSVRALDRDLPSLERRGGSSPQVLGEAHTDDHGRFRITFSFEQFNTGEGAQPIARMPGPRADISFRVVRPDGIELPIRNVRALGRDYGQDEIIFNAPTSLEATITVNAPTQIQRSEYEQLVTRIAPVISDVPAAELADDDIRFLIAELGFDQEIESEQRLQWLRRCALLASISQLPEEAFYGWGREGLPSPLRDLAVVAPDKVSSVLNDLFDTTEEQRHAALRKACDANIIPDLWHERVDDLERRLKQSRPALRHGTARLIDRSSKMPLGNLRVEISDPTASGLRAAPVSVVSDVRGLFPLLYVPPPTEDGAVPRTLRLKVLQAANRNLAPSPIFETLICVEADKTRVIDIPVPMPAATKRPDVTLDKLVSTANVDMPSRLQAFLASFGIKTLGDIRRNGGISQLQGLPLAADHAVVRRLEAHAELARVSSDLRSNEFLIEKGYESVRAIGQTTRAKFVSDAHEKLGDFNAAKVHVAAQAQMHFLDGVISGFKVSEANHYAHVDKVLSDGALPEHCSCRDCETAVSPLAYLIDLVRYTLKHVTDAGAPITLQTLTDSFHQPLAELAVNCETVDARVRQVRLCVEVLRGFVKTPLADATKQANLVEAEKAYRLAAYEELLLRIGTSFAELRLAQNADGDARQALADRLQVAVGKLGTLYLDPKANPAVLTENRLEELFGLVDTTRNPLDPGAVPRLQEWRLEQLHTLWRQQDFTDDLYDDGRSVAELRQLPAGIAFPPAIAARIKHDAESQQVIFKGPMSFEERGTLLILSPDVDFQRAIKQLYHVSQRLPVIDPDVVGPDDLREPLTGKTAFDLWKQRREWVDAHLDAFTAMEKPVAVGSTEKVPDFNAMLNAMYVAVTYDTTNIAPWPPTTPVSDLEKLSADLEGADVDKARFRVEGELNLSVEGFSYLMRVRAKNKAWWEDRRGERVSAEEWRSLRSILVQAIKRRFFLIWRAEETSKGLVFGPEAFWVSLTQPSEGIWPPVTKSGVPLIDPDLVKPNELPDQIVGERAIALWSKRQARVVEIHNKLEDERKTNGFDAMLRWALGHPSEGNPLQHGGLDTLKNELNDADPQKVEAATRKITDDLHLSLEGFRRLLVVKTRNEDPAEEKKPTAAEWDEVYALLTPARKIKHEYPAWVQEEQNPAIGVVYWTALKAKVPDWRSSSEARAGWQAALRARSRTAIVDPDLVGLGDLRDPVAGNAVFDLHQARKTAIANRLGQLQGYPKTSAGFDSMLQDFVGLTWTKLRNIAVCHDQGHTIGGRLDQLGLDFSRFNYLVRIGRLAESGGTILESEWTDVHDILLQVWKQRTAATWLAEEKEEDVLLGPDQLQILQLDSASVARPPVNAWRAPRAARQEWEEKLQTRINQRTTVVEALKSAVSAAEELTLAGLRNALITASNAPADSTNPEDRLEQQAKWITENLLIDAKMSGCTMTTRVAQAIETVQGLIHSLRTGQPQEHFDTWQLDLTHFDEEWKWMGTYAAWRGAMFVWMYPELLAQPGLKREERQTPGLQALLAVTRGNRRFGPEDACREAKRYAEYFEDVATLSVQATCIAQTRASKSDCNKTVTDERCFFYMFGLGGVTRKVYWSRYDFASSSGYAQAFWEPIASEIPEFDNIVEILGAVPFKVSSGRRFIFLLAKKVEANTTSLVYVKYDLDKSQWSQEDKAPTLEHPMGSSDFTVVVCQSDSESEAPHVLFYGAVSDGHNTRYRERKLNADGSGWELGPARPLDLEADQTAPPVGMVSRGGAFYLFVEANRVSAYVCFQDPQKPSPHPYLSNKLGTFPGSYVGAFSWVGVGGVFLLISRAKAVGVFGVVAEDVLYLLQSLAIEHKQFASPFPGDGASYYFVVGHSSRLRRILPTWGLTDYDGSKTKQFVYRSPSRIEHHRPLLIRDNSGEPSQFLASSHGRPVIPDIGGPFDISTGLSDADLKHRRDLQAAAADSIQSYSASLKAYLEEAFYSVRVALALALHRSGKYVAALDWFRTVYADGLEEPLRKIHPGLVAEESLPNIYKRTDDWLRDPLDPHSIAATRQNAYTRYTILAIVQCLLDYADAEFTRDTPESNPIARRLNMRALELLDVLQKNVTNKCDEAIGVLDGFPDQEWQVPMKTLQHELEKNIPDSGAMEKVTSAIGPVLKSNKSSAQKFAEARALVDQAIKAVRVPTLSQAIVQDNKLRSTMQASVAANHDVSEALDVVSVFAEEGFTRSVSVITGLSEAQLLKKSTSLEWLRQPVLKVDTTQIAGPLDLVFKTRPDGVVMDTLTKSYQGNLAAWAEAQPLAAYDITKKSYQGFVPEPILGFCIPPNPMLSTLRSRAEVNLFKLRTCRNIAGLKRALEPYAAPTDTQTGLPQIGAGGQIVLPGVRTLAPTLYRYATLIERAKQLVQLAEQIEGSLLAARQRLDEIAYSVLEARQELELADAGIRLQDLRIVESQSKITLATLAQTRAQFQAEHFTKLLAEGFEFENAALYEYALIEDLQGAMVGIVASRNLPEGTSLFAVTSQEVIAAYYRIGDVGVASALAGTNISFHSTRASAYSLRASIEQRKRDWTLQRDLAYQDVGIAAQQIQVATNEANVVQQERVIAGIQQNHARDTIEFLTTKQFGTPEQYEWMIDVLDGVYRYFLQQATAMARLAENQLAFERQETPPAFVRSDYWTLPEDGGASTGGTSSVNRRGITGSARLLQDIYQLDQYAFDTRKRKLPLTKTISLAKLAPIEFQQFRETGVMTFATPMEMFDRDFPGHYLRLISRLSVSVVALIPPTQGIHATLTSSGLSRVVIGPDVFQRVTIRRDLELIALSSPLSSTGVFELEPQNEMLRPFEGTGVDTVWEFRMPRAANQFDFRTLADVLITMDYTALSSTDYREQVIQSLSLAWQAETSFSFRNQFPDQWFDLHNPEQTHTPMTVFFRTLRDDFPSNLDHLRIDHVALYFSRSEGMRREISVDRFMFRDHGSAGPVGAGARTIQGLISTRLGSGTGWSGMVGRSPVGDWELVLPNTEEMRGYFTRGEIRDILLVISFVGSTPAWPK